MNIKLYILPLALILTSCEAAQIRDTLAEPQTTLIFVHRGMSMIKGPGGRGVLKIGAPSIETPENLRNPVLSAIREAVTEKFPNKKIRIVEVNHVKNKGLSAIVMPIVPVFPGSATEAAVLEFSVAGDFNDGFTTLRTGYSHYANRNGKFVFTRLVNLAKVKFPVHARSMTELEKELSQLSQEILAKIKHANQKAVRMRLGEKKCPKSFCVIMSIP